MPITLGILAQSRQAVAASDFVLLETQVLTGSQAAIEFTSLNATYGSIYKHLQLRIVSRDSRATTGGNNVRVTFNGDTGANYAFHRLRGDGSSVSSFGGTSANSMNLFTSVSANDTANAFGAAVMDILEPFVTTKNKTVRVLHGYVPGTSPAVELRSGLWMNTNALTTIRLAPETTGNFVEHSRFSLYGVR